MLGSYPVDVMLLATDLGVARRFYEGTLGLPLSVEDEQFLAFGCGGDSRLVVTKSTTGTREAVTKASWRVDDLAGEIAWLRARGVQIQELPELGTADGVADVGFALAAWFVDPTTTGSACCNSKHPPGRPHGAAIGTGHTDGSEVPGSGKEAR
jgi:catechol 2,3-dioxygenase-like lactoylglutathione lyase family enzyme